MKYLFIDSATSHLILAVMIDGEIKYLYDEEVGKDMSSIIMVKMEEAFKKSEIKPSDLDKILVVNGPGSFTGIRVGLTITKTMAWTLKIPVVPISSLEVMASGANNDMNVALINARRGYVFAGGYDANLNIVFNDEYITLSSLTQYDHLISYDDFDIYTEKPIINLKKVIDKHCNDLGVNPHELKPNYLKNTEAEENLLNHVRSN